MEEKHPIKFSLAQFILLLALEVVVLGAVFFLGARFGGSIFPEHYARQFRGNSPLQGLEPSKVDRLGLAPPEPQEEETLEEDQEDPSPAADAPHYRVGADGSTQLEESEEPQEDLQPAQHSRPTPRYLPHADEKTMVRFKSSGQGKFSIEVGQFFDELVASKKIRDLKAGGYEAFLVIPNPDAPSPSYSVRVGIFGDRTLAEEFATHMSNKEGLELQVVRAD